VHRKFVKGFKRFRDAGETSRIIEVFGHVVALFDGSETEKKKSNWDESLINLNLVLKFVCNRINIAAEIGKFRNVGALGFGTQ
jgi:hypothetical protein